MVAKLQKEVFLFFNSALTSFFHWVLWMVMMRTYLKPIGLVIGFEHSKFEVLLSCNTNSKNVWFMIAISLSWITCKNHELNFLMASSKAVIGFLKQWVFLLWVFIRKFRTMIRIHLPSICFPQLTNHHVFVNLKSHTCCVC